MNNQCKKVQRDEESSNKKRRKSPVKSRAESSGIRKAQQQQSRFRSLREDGLQGPPSRTRASLKRRHHEPSSSKIKVEDYYEIIEEPMDFGTMRAKLHEGLYTSLEQFELQTCLQNDVYLISGNAMHFNSSGTIFFRQAHGIHKLAKRVFHVLRTSPETFELEFGGNRRRSFRRSEDGFNELNCKSFFKPDKRGSRDGKECDSIEVDRRSTYKPPLDLNNDKYSKSLIHLHQHQQEHSYRDSLLQFAKDLGPTAQMVAKRKLQNLYPHPQTTRHNFSHQLQIPFAQTWSNPYHSFINDGTMQTSSIVTHSHIMQDQDMRSVYGTMQTSSIVTNSHITQDQDLRSVYGTDHVERTRDSMLLSYSGGHLDSSVITSVSMPTWLRQPSHGSKFALDLNFLKSRMGEDTSSKSYKAFDAKDLTLQL
ncbi:Bromodomain-containing protein [Artemisia annua]|uniref:Bromodomain-containing protein n=1 Tax=Artemisia annua TaxID=35608 RepID=A0A2U1PFR7_ARTAN|nr:Bromodomain-containing protein [Artemisia annua]